MALTLAQLVEFSRLNSLQFVCCTGVRFFVLLLLAIFLSFSPHCSSQVDGSTFLSPAECNFSHGGYPYSAMGYILSMVGI